MLARVVSLMVMLATATCVRGPSLLHHGAMLETLGLAAHASEFYCEFGHWPEDAEELETFSPPERSRVSPTPSSPSILWLLLRDAEFQREADGALFISTRLPSDSLMEAPRSRPVDINLRVQEPGCWPPVAPPT